MVRHMKDIHLSDVIKELEGHKHEAIQHKAKELRKTFFFRDANEII